MQPLSSFTTKQGAIDHIEYDKKLLPVNSLNSILARVGIFRACQIISTTDGHPAQDAMLAMLDPKTDKLNFIEGDPTGDIQIQMLDDLIAANITQTVGQGNLVEVSTQLAVAKPILIHFCNTPYQPYKDITERDWQLAKKTITYSPVVAVDNVVQITTSADVEPHKPQIYQLLNNSYYKRVAGFDVVSKADTYEAMCPMLNNLYVDNAYGVI